MFVIGLVVGVVAGFVCGVLECAYYMRKEAVRRGHARWVVADDSGKVTCEWAELNSGEAAGENDE